MTFNFLGLNSCTSVLADNTIMRSVSFPLFRIFIERTRGNFWSLENVRCNWFYTGTTPLMKRYQSSIPGITFPSLATNPFTYNGLDTRVSKVDSGGTKGFLRDGASVTDPVLSDGAASYTPGISESRSGVSTFYGQDQLGSVTLQTNSSSSITYKASYDAFGAIKSSTGSSASPFGFAGGAGYQQDSDSGLMLLGHRYYDSSTGRFLTRDPVKDGSNWYDYCHNSPTFELDPYGFGFLSWVKDKVATVADWLDEHGPGPVTNPNPTGDGPGLGTIAKLASLPMAIGIYILAGSVHTTHKAPPVNKLIPWYLKPFLHPHPTNPPGSGTGADDQDARKHLLPDAYKDALGPSE